MNLCDRAQEAELEDWIRRQQEEIHSLSGAPSALRCDDCDEEIPLARREASPGCTRCAFCQGIYESKKKRGLIK